MSDTSSIQVAIPSHQNKSVFDYLARTKCKIGDLVKVSFRNKELIGVVWSCDPSRVEPKKLKYIEEKTNICLRESQVSFLKFMCNYNLLNLGSLINLITSFYDSSTRYEVEDSEYIPQLAKLNDDQNKSLQSILENLQGYTTTLLKGVTGSGKTEVYSHALAEVLKGNGSQVLVLLPEIMLTNQFVLRFEDRFGSKPMIWHSQVSKKRKKEIWNLISKGKKSFIIGARSALLLPFQNLKMIVLDEEHDSSYKQEDGLIYNARDMAVAYSHFNKSPIILASATPSVETMHNVMVNKYKALYLPSRYGDNVMPEISVVDMRESNLKKNQWISYELRKKINYAIEQNSQTMLFLNRKGYAPISLCKSCGYKECCELCDSFLVAYKSKNQLICNHCGYKKTLSNACSECAVEDSMINCGPGVERIEEEVKILWPNANTIVVTKDTVNEKNSEEILRKIINNEIDIIIGTQILSKGHHFPKLNLVGVLDADIGLIGADLRASERTYQLLTQVSGRSGRESRGSVVIQTYYPKNDVLKSLQNNNSKEFYDSEIKIRKIANMPPFKKLIAIILSDSKQERVEMAAKTLSKSAQYTQDVSILGPVPAPMALLRGRYRYRFLVRSNISSKVKTQYYVKKWIESTKIPSTVRVKVDVDPYSFL